MAQSATRFAKRPARARSNRHEVASASDDAPDELRVIPLKLAPLVAPYRKHGRLSIRVERVSQLARLSHGRNNGDGTWSLASDELEDLAYLTPEGMSDEHTLAVRIIGLDGGAATSLAVLDFPISPSAGDSGSRDGATSTAGAADEAQLRRLRDELANAKAALAARDSDLAETQRLAEEAATEFSKKMETALADARAAWDAELDERLAAAAVEAAADLQERREAWQAEHTSRVSVSEARERERAAELRERWQRETQEALLKAEKVWKAEEGQRFASAQAKWQEQLANALEEVRAETAAVRGHSDDAVTRLRKDLAALKATLKERDAALADADLEGKRAHEQWQRETENALLQAETLWQAAEAARFAASETAWQERSEKAVADARAQAKSARDLNAKVELRRLQDKLADLESAIAERDAALARAQSAVEEAEQGLRATENALAKAEAQWQAAETARFKRAAEEAREQGLRATENALAKAEAEWQAAETARFHAAQARWRAQSDRAMADVATLRKEAEAALADVKAEADADAKAFRESADSELRRLRGEGARMQAALSGRETELAATRVAADEAYERLQRESEMALAKAKAVWSADSAARLSQAQAQWQEHLSRAEADAAAKLSASDARWREQYAKDQAEAAARSQQADAALARARAEAGADVQHVRHQVETELFRLRNDCAHLQETLTARDQELANTRHAHERAREDWLQASDAAMSAARAAWKADEAAHLSAVEVQWRKQSGGALADATARAESAEAALAEVRRSEASRDRGDDIVARRLRDELALLQASLADRETELARLRVLAGEAEEPGPEDSKIVIRSNHDRDVAANRDTQNPPRAKRHLLPGAIVAAALAASAMLFYPSILSFMPDSLRSHLGATTTDSALPAATAEPHKVVTRDTNVRSGPSTSTAVVSTLARGREVAILEQRGNWILIRYDGENGKPSRQGWVFSTFLRDSGDAKPAAKRE